jgi:hypothetical protein
MRTKEMKGSGSLFLLLIGLFFLSVFTSNAQAAEARAEAQEQAIREAENASLPAIEQYRQTLRKAVVIKEEYFPNALDSYLRQMPSRGAKAQSGKVGIVEAASEYSYQVKAFGKLPVEFALGAGYIGINNTTAVKLPAHLTSTAFGLETTVPFFNLDKTYFTLGAAALFASDDWNFRSSSFRIPQRYFLIYQPNEQWTFIGGVGVWPDYDEVVWPILGFIYKPNDRLTFNIVPKGPEISYDVNEKLTVFGEGDMSTAEYEVTKDGRKNVVLEYNEVHLGAGLRYKFNRYIKGSVAAGGIFGRSLKYRDDSLGKVAIENGLYSEFRMEIDF